MKRYTHARVTSACAIGVLLVVSTMTTIAPAQAAPDDGPIVGWTLPPGETLTDDPRAIAEKPLTDALLELFQVYDAIEVPGLSDARFAELEASARELQTIIERESGEPYEILAAAPDVMTQRRTGRAGAAASVAVPASNFLPVKHSTQINAYFCGPASTLMALRAMGSPERSQLNSAHQLSQDVLASSTYLGTKRNGTYIGRMPTTMKSWAGVSSQVYPSPSRPALKSMVRRNNGQFHKALIYGTRELRGEHNPHYNHHYTNQTLDHFVMGYGYSENGDRLHYADPVADRWPEPKEKRSMTTNAMAGFVSEYGAVG